MDKRIQVTVVSGGYNYNLVDRLVNEEWPRWTGEHIKFVTEDTDVRMYIDYPFENDSSIIKTAKCSIAVVEEPYWCVPHFDIFIRSHSTLFDIIFTNHPYLLSLGFDNLRYYPGAQTHIPPDKRSINEKNKLLCAIFSTKKYADGHQLRQQIKSDLFFNPFVDYINSVPFVENSYEDKWQLLQPYMYNLAIENTFDEQVWTEKLLDCFTIGCIPIYKGNKRVKEYFNMNGIMEFDTIDELKEIVKFISTAGRSHYYNVMPAIKDNFERVKKLINLGDVLWTHGLEDVFKRKGII